MEDIKEKEQPKEEKKEEREIINENVYTKIILKLTENLPKADEKLKKIKKEK